jgi:hypothetical protein
MTRLIERSIVRAVALSPHLENGNTTLSHRDAMLRILERGDEITRWLKHDHEEDAWLARVEITAGLRGAGVV